MSPLWLLDFDGVVNAISRRGDRNVWDDWEAAEVTVATGESFPLLWSPSVVGVINEAVDAGVEVVWLTTWRDETQLLPKVIDGLPDLMWWDEEDLTRAGHGLDPLHTLNQRWKSQVARALVPDGAPLLWTDDNLDLGILRSDDRDWLRRRPGGSTVITPHETIGLSKKNIRDIREWIADHS